jgi:hypothetical protein
MTSSFADLRFTGEPDDRISADEFLRRFQIHQKTEKWDPSTTIEMFELALGGEGTVARKWWEGLDGITTGSWTLLSTAFKKEYPATPLAARSQGEYENDLLEAQLPEAKVGRREKDKDRESWSHITFADKLLALAQRAGIASGSTMISIAHRNLPKPIRERLKSTYTTWSDFTKAIREVDPVLLSDFALSFDADCKKAEAQEKRLCELETLARNAVRNNTVIQDSPTRGLRTGFSNFTVSSPPPSPSRNRQTPRPNPSQTSQRQTIPRLTEEEKATLRAGMNVLPIQPDTPEGRKAWTDQVVAWRTQHGAAEVKFDTPFPLQPGTAPAGTRECWKCGQNDSHDYRTCTRNPVNPREITWRKLVAFNLGHDAGLVREVRSLNDVSSDLENFLWGGSGKASGSTD